MNMTLEEMREVLSEEEVAEYIELKKWMEEHTSVTYIAKQLGVTRKTIHRDIGLALAKINKKFGGTKGQHIRDLLVPDVEDEMHPTLELYIRKLEEKGYD